MVKASDLFLTNTVKDGTISAKVALELAPVELIDSKINILSTPIYLYQTSIPIAISSAISYKNKQFLRSEVVDNAQTVDLGVALLANDYALSWGKNNEGGIGDGTTTNRSSPVSVLGGRKISQVITSNVYNGTLSVFKSALDFDGYAWSWGSNSSGQLGDGTTNDRSSPVSVISECQFVTISTGDTAMISALDLSGCAWSWGNNSYGQLGDGTTTNRSSPVSVLGDMNFVAIRGTVAVDINNKVWSWGLNDNGQLGDGTTTDKSSPVLMLGSVGSSGNVTALAKGQSFAVMLTNKGNCYTVGINNFGQLGDGTIINKSTPILLNNRFVQIASGSYHTLGLDSDGVIWSWGENLYGQLGDGTNIDRSVPISIFSDNKYIMIGASAVQSIAVDVDGYIWCWGNSSDGSLGSNSNNASIPVSVVGGYRSRLRKIY